MITEIDGYKEDKLIHSYMKWEKDALLYTRVSEVIRIDLSFWGWVTCNGDVSMASGFWEKMTNYMLGDPRHLNKT